MMIEVLVVQVKSFVVCAVEQIVSSFSSIR